MFGSGLKTTGVLTALSMGLVAVPLAAQAPEHGGFLLLRGNDTLAVESFDRSATAASGSLLVGVLGQRIQYRLVLTPEATVSRLELGVRPATAPDTAPPMQRGSLTFEGDSVAMAGASGVTRKAVPPGTLPYLNLSGNFLEQIIRRSRKAGGAAVPLLNPDGNVFTATVTPAAGDSVVLSLGGVELRLRVDATGRLLGGVVPAQGVRIERVASANAGPAAATDYSAPAGAPYVAEAVTVPGPAGPLAGTLTLPRRRAGRIPAVVTITGSGTEDRDEALGIVPGYRPFRQVADTLGRRGIAVLRMDDRGFGGSGSDAASATSEDFARDIEAGVAYLRSRPEIDPARIALVGHSEGGLIAPMIAAQDPRIRALVLMAPPAWTGRRIISAQNRYMIAQNGGLSGAGLDSAVARAMVTVDSTADHNPWLKFFLDYDPLPAARKVHVPVLILQGATDRQVDPRQAEELAAAFRAGGDRDVTVRVFPDHDHLFLQDPSGNPAGYSALPVRTIDTGVMGTLADWLARHLATTSPGGH